MILLVDNYDSFVFNLARYFERLGQSTVVVRNDAVTIEGIAAQGPDAIVLSPGPCTPQEAGGSIEIVRHFASSVPILGICLGHQAIGAALGGRVVRAAEPVHGRTSPIHHNEQGVFAGLPNPLVASRYHSLAVERASLPESLQVTAWTADQEVMAVAHRDWPVVGVQFHPESILTDVGYRLLAGFLRLASLPVPAALPTIDDERVEPAPPPTAVPARPVTF